MTRPSDEGGDDARLKNTANSTSEVPERPQCPFNERVARIRHLNDTLRQKGSGGSICVTRGVETLGIIAVAEIIQRVADYDQFDCFNDPYEEHDFGHVSYDEHKLFWKVDYYDKTLSFGSPDPTDTALTHRVLTIMLATEY